ncbi:M28 family peptidase [Anaeroselena agilis]|uniref:M28 family peptidase n=1 Tax=Anaeroselena agilis TaxID=3063788 RepID=A0ABU3NVT5_9FIRM|nr:M28 family peptidase [Selenomonadales bacterium 4137-cl]
MTKSITFEGILKSSQKELLTLIPKVLEARGYEVTANDDFIYAKGDVPILLVSHLDTVHYGKPKDIFHDKKQGVLWSPQGIGGDDRCGVYAMLEISCYKPHLLFCTDEESGCKGARAVVKAMPKAPDVKYIIELDRKGKNDCVFYSDRNEEFHKYVKTFGWMEAYGSFSDISTLCPSWGISGVNLSIGYYEAHTKQEYINLFHMRDCISKIKEMLRTPPAEVFKYVGGYYGGGYGGYYKDYDWDTRSSRRRGSYFPSTSTGRKPKGQTIVKSYCKTCHCALTEYNESKIPSTKGYCIICTGEDTWENDNEIVTFICQECGGEYPVGDASTLYPDICNNCYQAIMSVK